MKAIVLKGEGGEAEAAGRAVRRMVGSGYSKLMFSFNFISRANAEGQLASHLRIVSESKTT